MSAPAQALRSKLVEGQGAGRTGRALRSLPSRCYQDGSRETRGRAVVLSTPQGRRIAGRLTREDDRVWLEKQVDPARHLHRRFDAWGVDAGLLDSLEAEGVFGVRCVLTTGTVEEAPVSAFRDHGFRFDFGHGPQVFLQRRFWTRRDPKQLGLLEEVE